MAKLPAKKPKLTPEEQLAELAALTGDVAAINLMHSPAPAPAPVPPAAPVSAPTAPAAPAPAAKDAVTAQVAPASAATAAEQVTSPPPASDGGGEGQPKGKSASADVAPTPMPVPQPAVEEQPVTKQAPIATPAPAPASTAETTATDDDSALEEAATPAGAPTRGAGTAYSLDALFEPSKDKKTVMMRITPALHQYFQQIGLLLGDGASVPDVVHNILLEWKTLHGQEVQKALQKQMRLMLKNAS